MRMRFRPSLIAAAAMLAVAAPVAAFDLNGTWSGRISCTGLFDGERDSVTVQPTLIINDGAVLFLSANSSNYTGFPFPSAIVPEKGEIAIIRCDTTPNPTGAEFGGEFGRLKVSTKPSNGKGSLTGTTYKASTLIAPSVYTCKWSFKRISSACSCIWALRSWSAAGALRSQTDCWPGVSRLRCKCFGQVTKSLPGECGKPVNAAPIDYPVRPVGRRPRSARPPCPARRSRPAPRRTGRWRAERSRPPVGRTWCR